MGRSQMCDALENVMGHFPNHHGVILGMDWLGKYRATLDCHLGRVQLEKEFGPRLSTKESSQPLVVGGFSSPIERMLGNGWEAFWLPFTLMRL
ncbi:hypothetical protein Bca101_050438 [Brassica carinata]